jgi:hypothetical protein
MGQAKKAIIMLRSISHTASITTAAADNIRPAVVTAHAAHAVAGR